MQGLKLGPGVLVAAAFIGPGTVTTCVVAGANFGTSLLWTLIFATLATIVLQEMAARLGAGARQGLGEALTASLLNPTLRWIAIVLVFTAILLGNAAYQGGNLAGAALGAGALVGADVQTAAVLAVSAAAAAVLLPGRYRVLERVLIGFVVIMSVSFLTALLLVRPDLGAVAKGLVPSLPDGSLLTVIALIGTTIVPYNLFLHAATAKERWHGPLAVRDARRDTVVAILLGGAVSASVLLVASMGTGAGNAVDLAKVLEPSFGSASRWLVGIGLLAAGMSSAITAPMAAGFVASELFSSSEEGRKRTFRIVSMLVLGFGAFVALLGIRPQALIVLAQAANGVLLPVVAAFLLVVMNRTSVLGRHANGILPNVLGASVLLITLFLGIRGVSRAIGIWP